MKLIINLSLSITIFTLTAGCKKENINHSENVKEKARELVQAIKEKKVYEGTRAIDREKAYQSAQATVLSDTLAKIYTGNGKCLVIHNAISKIYQKELMALINSFKKGFQGKVKNMIPVPIKNFIVEETLPQGAIEENTAEDFNKVIRENSDCDVIIIMCQLPSKPEELIKMKIFELIQNPANKKEWIKDPKRNYPVIGIFNGYIGNLKPFFLDNLIKAMTLWKPDPILDDKPVPKSILEAFNKRYLVITPENINKMNKDYPVLFPKPRK